MKKLIITITLALGLGMSLNAQNDSFFTYNSIDNKRSEWGTMPVLPTSAGETADYGANPAPLGSGIILLAGLALAYGRKRNNS